MLLESGADPNNAGANVGGSDWGETTPFLVATRGGFTEAMQLLLDHGADPTLVPKGSEPAIKIAKGIDVAEVREATVAFLEGL